MRIHITADPVSVISSTPDSSGYIAIETVFQLLNGGHLS